MRRNCNFLGISLFTVSIQTNRLFLASKLKFLVNVALLPKTDLTCSSWLCRNIFCIMSNATL